MKQVEKDLMIVISVVIVMIILFLITIQMAKGGM